MVRMITAVIRRRGVLARGIRCAAAPLALAVVIAIALAGQASAAPIGVQASLSVSDSHPVQAHGVQFDASGSSGPVVTYVFNYGDGIVESTYQPLMMHGYRDIGTYNATVTVLDAQGHSATSSAVTVQVSDGTPPVVAIDSPRPNQTMRLGSRGILLRGRATDSGSGVKRVQLAIQLVSSSQHFKTGGGCIWFNGKLWLSLAGCATPRYFTSKFANGRWSFRMNPATRIPAGTYVVRVRGTDYAGNVSYFYAIRLRTIVPFRFAR
jgi:PKD domain/Bacterial Ig domain